MSFHDPGMRRGARFLGAIMVLGAGVLLLLAPSPFSPWHFLLFLSFFVPGGLLAMGWLLLPSKAPQPPAPRLDMPRGLRRVAFVLATLGAAALFCLGIVLALAGGSLLPMSGLDRVAVAGVPLVGGGGLLAYLWRHR
jgi:hypothetical protein